MYSDTLLVTNILGPATAFSSLTSTALVSRMNNYRKPLFPRLLIPSNVGFPPVEN
jgi:hypothetical protein